MGENVDPSAYGIITSAETRAGVRSEIFDVFFKGKLDVKKYFSDLDLDSEDFFLDLSAKYDLDKKNSFGFSAGYNQESTLTAELDITGLTQENVPRTSWSVSPDWIHNLSETKYIQVNYTHTDTSYEESTTTRFSYFTYDSVSLSFYHQWNDNLLNFITTGWSRFSVPVSKSETDQYIVNAGLDYNISETWTASLMGGVRFTLTEQSPNSVEVITNSGEISVFDQPAFSDSQTGLVFSFGTKKQFETGNIGASYSRSTDPTGDGRLRTIDRFKADFLHKITQQLHFILNGGISITKSTADDNAGSDRTYYTVTPTIRWQFDRQLSLSGGYRYRRQEREQSITENSTTNNSQDTGESHSIFITLKYQWDPFTKQDF